MSIPTERLEDQKAALSGNQISYFDEMKAWRESDIPGIPAPFEGLSDDFKITKKRIYLYGAEEGIGKSAFVDYLYILKAYQWVRDHPETGIRLRVVLFAMERTRQDRVAKWASLILWSRHGVLLGTEQMLQSQRDYKTGKRKMLPDQVKDAIEEAKDFLDWMQANGLLIVTGSQNPTGIWKFVKEDLLKRGTYTETRHSSYTEGHYQPHDNGEIYLGIVDHIGNLSREEGLDQKGLIDRLIYYQKSLRDVFGVSWVDVSQFNRKSADVIRRTKIGLVPERSDFKGSGDPSEAADFVCGLFNPYVFGMEHFEGYAMPKFVSEEGDCRFRSARILKNSFGRDNVMASFHFLGECGQFMKLPPPTRIPEGAYHALANPPTNNEAYGL